MKRREVVPRIDVSVLGDEAWHTVDHMRGIDHTDSRAQKISSRGKNHSPYYVVAIRRALDLQSYNFNPREGERQHALYREAFDAVTQKNIPKTSGEMKKFAKKLARRDPAHKDFWSEYSDNVSWRSASLSMGAIRSEQLNPLGKESLSMEDPIMEKLFENDGVLIKTLAGKLTGKPTDEMSVLYAGRQVFHENPQTTPQLEMKPLRGKDDISTKALRCKDLIGLYKEYKRAYVWGKFKMSTVHVRAEFAEVVDANKEIIMKLEFGPETSFFDGLFPEDDSDKYFQGMKSGKCKVSVGWLGRKSLSGLEKGSVLQDMFFPKDSVDDVVGLEKTRRDRDIFIRQHHKNGHRPDMKISKNGHNGNMRGEEVYMPLGDQMTDSALPIFSRRS